MREIALLGFVWIITALYIYPFEGAQGMAQKIINIKEKKTPEIIKILGYTGRD